jgi:histidinol dehydrogenase
VLSRIDLRGEPAADLTAARLAAVLPRAELDVAAVLPAVGPICEDVRKRGAEAVREYTATFDGVDLPTTVVPREALARALGELDPAVVAALREAIRRTRLVHQSQLPTERVTVVAGGASVTERYVPVARAGVYVPGGLVAYPSSVVMNVVPAQVAGVGQIVVASPPQQAHNGLPHPSVLAACELLGITEVHAVGGAQAVAMLGYGTVDCQRVDVITGPGNVYVAAAKRLLRGIVGTDADAGPTEIAIIADADADARFVAADLIAQAEHDSLAACLLITPDPELADRVDEELTGQVAAARHAGRIKEALTGQSACVLVDDLAAALAVADGWAPEHLEIQAAGAAELAARVRNAGAVFVGSYAPVSLGDYLAGSNHVLPTGGTARHSGGLSVLTFLRVMHVVECTADALASVAPHIDALGSAEDLAGHVAAVRARVGVVGAAEGCARPALPVRPDLAGRKPYGAPQLDADTVIRLNTNENPYPPSAALVAEIERVVGVAAASLNRYPDRDATELRRDLAAYLGRRHRGITLGGGQIWVANGSNEIIQQLFQVFGGSGRRALGFEPSYSMHPIIAATTGTAWSSAAREDDFGIDAGRALAAVREVLPDLVFLTSPNNPTGTPLSLDVIERICAAAPGMVVVDEAYAEFANDDAGTALSLLPRLPRLVVVRTMSKAFALAGARIGYLAAGPDVVDALQIVRLPYHLSALTQATARAALARSDDLLARIASLRSARDELIGWLRARGLSAADSAANFVLFGQFEDRHAVWQRLLDEGVLIREVGPQGWLRVTIGTPAEMDAFRTALEAVLA